MPQVPDKVVASYPPPPGDEKERMRVFLKNRRQFPMEEWLRHLGRHYAMSWDGLAILASAPDFDGLLRRLDELEINSEHVSFGYIPEDDGSICLGAAEIEYVDSETEDKPGP